MCCSAPAVAFYISAYIMYNSQNLLEYSSVNYGKWDFYKMFPFVAASQRIFLMDIGIVSCLGTSEHQVW